MSGLKYCIFAEFKLIPFPLELYILQCESKGSLVVLQYKLALFAPFPAFEITV